MLTVIRLGLPNELRRSLGCTNAIETARNSRTAAALPQRQTLARRTDGFAMDWNRHAGSREELPPFEGPQAASDLRAALLRHQQALLGDQPIASKNLAAYGFNQWRLPHQCQQVPGLSACPDYTTATLGYDFREGQVSYRSSAEKLTTKRVHQKIQLPPSQSGTSVF